MALTAKQKLFCEEYVAAGYKEQAECYKRAFSNPNPNTARGEASKLLKKPEIQEYIREIQHDRFMALNISADRIAEELAKMAFGEVGEETGLKYADKKGALDLLQKQLGLQKQNITADVASTIDITIEVEKHE